MRTYALIGIFTIILALAIETANAAAFDSNQTAVSSPASLQDTNSKIYVIGLNSSTGSLKLGSIAVEEGLAKEYEHNANTLGGNWYECRMFSFSGRLLKRFFFEHPSILYWDSPDPNTGRLTGGSVPMNETTLWIEYFPDAKEINFYSQNGTLALSVDVSRFSDKGQIDDRPPKDLTGVWRHGDITYYIQQIGNDVWWLGKIFPPDETNNGAGLYMLGYGTVRNYTLDLKYAELPASFKENGTVVLDVVSEDVMEFREGTLDNFRGSYLRVDAGR